MSPTLRDQLVAAALDFFYGDDGWEADTFALCAPPLSARFAPLLAQAGSAYPFTCCEHCGCGTHRRRERLGHDVACADGCNAVEEEVASVSSNVDTDALAWAIHTARCPDRRHAGHVNGTDRVVAASVLLELERLGWILTRPPLSRACRAPSQDPSVLRGGPDA